MPSKVLNRVGLVVDETGSAYTYLQADTLISELYNTPAQAGGVHGDSYWWLVEDGTNFMLFEGTLTIDTSDVRVNIGTIAQSKIAGVSGTTKLTLSGNATLRSPTPQQVIANFLRMDLTQSFSDAEKLIGRGNLGTFRRGTEAQTNLSGLSTKSWTVPAGTTHIKLSLVGCSGTGSGIHYIQLGDAGGIEASGYVGSAVQAANAAAISAINYSNAYFLQPAAAAGNVIQGTIHLTREDAGAFVWVAEGFVGNSDAAAGTITAGYKATSAELTTVLLGIGSGTWDAGGASIQFDAP